VCPLPKGTVSRPADLSRADGMHRGHLRARIGVLRIGVRPPRSPITTREGLDDKPLPGSQTRSGKVWHDHVKDDIPVPPRDGMSHSVHDHQMRMRDCCG
jgi:hypothetical protein